MNEYNIAIVVKLIYTHGCSIDIIQKEFYCEYCYSNEFWVSKTHHGGLRFVFDYCMVVFKKDF